MAFTIYQCQELSKVPWSEPCKIVHACQHWTLSWHLVRGSLLRRPFDASAFEGSIRFSALGSLEEEAPPQCIAAKLPITISLCPNAPA